MNARTQPGPRERLLDAAQRLSYTHGVNVGVDALLNTANVARRSLYEHFGGKDALIAEVLRRAAAEDEARYRAVTAAAGADPRQRLLAVFDELDNVTRAPNFRGCRYLGADLALADDTHRAHAVTRRYRDTIHQLLEHEVTRLRHPRPGYAADQLLLLIDGALAAGANRGRHVELEDVACAVERNVGEIDVAPLPVRLGAGMAGVAPAMGRRNSASARCRQDRSRLG